MGVSFIGMEEDKIHHPSNMEAGCMASGLPFDSH